MSESTVEWLIGTFISVIGSVAAATAWITNRINAIEKRSVARDEANRAYCDSLHTQIGAMKEDNNDKFIRTERVSELKRDLMERLDRIEDRVISFMKPPGANQ